MNEEYSKLALVVGNLFSRVQELNTILHQLAEKGVCQGELLLTHCACNGETTPLSIHIDGTDFTLMLADESRDFRLDIGGMALNVE